MAKATRSEYKMWRAGRAAGLNEAEIALRTAGLAEAAAKLYAYIRADRASRTPFEKEIDTWSFPADEQVTANG